MGDYVNGVMHRGIHRGVGINVWIVWISFKKWWRKGTDPEDVCNTRVRQRGQGNFELSPKKNYNASSRRAAHCQVLLRTGSHLF